MHVAARVNAPNEVLMALHRKRLDWNVKDGVSRSLLSGMITVLLRPQVKHVSSKLWGGIELNDRT